MKKLKVINYIVELFTLISCDDKKMGSVMQLISLRELIGRDGQIKCSCLIGQTLYIVVHNYGLLSFRITLRGLIQVLLVLDLPRLKRICNFGPRILLLDLGSKVFLWDVRKRRANFLLRKRDYEHLKTFKEWISLGRFSERRVCIYSKKGVLVSSFKTRRDPSDVYVNNNHFFVSHTNRKTMVYLNDGNISLIRTIETPVFSLDEHYLYCVSFKYRKYLHIINLISLASLEMVRYFVVEPPNWVSAIAPLGPNKVLVRTRYNFYLFEFQDLQQDRQGKQLWKSEEGDTLPLLQGLYVLNTSDPNRYVCIEVCVGTVRTIQIFESLYISPQKVL